MSLHFQTAPCCRMENSLGLKSGSPDVHFGRGDWRNNSFGVGGSKIKQW